MDEGIDRGTEKRPIPMEDLNKGSKNSAGNPYHQNFRKLKISNINKSRDTKSLLNFTTNCLDPVYWSIRRVNDSL
jgi:hypothetical protein